MDHGSQNYLPAMIFLQVTYRLKQRKKKPMGSEMKFGVNIAAPFVGMKRSEEDEYPYAKQVMGATSS